MTKPPRAPGCYGLPSVFSFKSKVCPKCPHFDECRRECHDALRRAVPSHAIQAALIEHDRFDEGPMSSVGVARVECVEQGAAPLQARPSRKKLPILPLTDAQRDIVRAVPMRVGDELERLFKRGKDVLIRADLMAQREPLAEFTGHRSLKLALAMLRGGFTKQSLRMAFVTELGWNERAAKNEVSLMWSMLPALGVAIEQRDSLVVAPTLVTNNRDISRA